MISYVKFLTEIISNKLKIKDNETITLTEECSTIIHNMLAPKLKDLMNLTIPYAIGTTIFDRALCDLGASVSLMPVSICKRLDFDEIKATIISLHLDYRSIKYLVQIL